MYEHLDRDKKLLGVEIGVAEGLNSKRMLDEFENLTLIGIDPFEGYKDWWGYVSAEYMSERETLAKENLKDHIESNRFTLLKKYSDSALEDLEDGKYDFVYVDGDHSYEWALHDMNKYWNKVKDGGILCGHDRSLDGVRKALEEFTATIDKNFTASENPQQDSWYIIKTGSNE